MQITVLRLRRFILNTFFVLTVSVNAYAADMSAIDFNGNLLGKVIPDGSVISFDNEVIGHITADGFAADESDNLIGSVVPQGVAISYENNILGKVNNDGSVTASNDKLVGKALPNGLVVNDNYDVLGAVVATGLVYNDNGKIVGRISGDGKFYNLAGENSGYVTASGYVFAPTGTENKISLIGKLISSKMVISSSGEFIGSVTPDGKVINQEKKIVGSVHANGFVYDPDGMIIGHIVENGYAFKFNGDYLGVVSYDGSVINQGDIVARAVYGNRVIGDDGQAIGFTVNMSATANTLDGKYLGRISDKGIIVKARDAIGKIGASGKVVDNEGKIIGIINATGPVFDYLGRIRANAAVGGKVVSLDGTELGYMQNENAYDRRGKELGKLLNGYVNYKNNNEFIGVSGINSLLKSNKENFIVSPYGYVFDENNEIVGRSYVLSSIISPDGSVLSYISSNGNTESPSINKTMKITSAGILLDTSNTPAGNVIHADYATDFQGNAIGYTSHSNNIINNHNQENAKILADYSVVGMTGTPAQYKGKASNADISISINGDYLGTNKYDGTVKNIGNQIGKISSNGEVLDNMGALYGATLPYGVVVSPECQFLGVVSGNGDARTAKDSLLGTILTNRQVINDNEEVIGQVIVPEIVNGENRKSIGVQSPLGTVLNYNNEILGCQDFNGKIRNPQGDVVGQLVPNAVAMDYDNRIIGTTGFAGNVINAQREQVALIGIDDNIYSETGKNIGVLFRYKVAFDNNNTYLGRINNQGEVVSDSGDVLGQVNYNGLVKMKNGNNGFALYDLYVYDNDGKTVGYIAKNGQVYSIMGELKGTVYNGFVIDKKQNLIARGARDYYIRNDNHEIVGYLDFMGNVISNKNVVVGTLGERGNITDTQGNRIATADPLQYYHEPEIENDVNNDVISEQELEQKEVLADEPRENEIDTNLKDSTSDNINDNISSDIAGDITSNIADDDYTTTSPISHKVIGIAVTPGGKYIGDIYSNNEVIDADGKVIGTKDSEGKIRNTSGEIIGVAQDKKKEKNKAANSNWWKEIMNGVTASPYNTNDEAVNVGPAGGVGPGGRYNPKRAQIISQLQNSRRQSLSGKSISSNFNVSSYTGWQDDWGITRSVSTLRVDMSNMIGADKPIPAVMARSMISLGSAPITAIVERNVYADSGRNVIIPAGSRIIGGLDDDDEIGTDGRFDGTSGGVKLEINWQRIIRPDGIAFILDDGKTQTGDAQGRGGGALGYVDEQLVKKYTIPLFGTLATSAISYMMAADEDATGEVETSKQQAASEARQQFLEKMNDILDKILESKEEIQPVTFVPAGTRIIIYPRTDLWLRTAKDAESGVSSSIETDKPKVLIDDTQNVNENNTNTNPPLMQNNNNQSNNNNNGTAPLLENSNQAQQNNTQNRVGAIPPPAADGTVTTSPYDDDEISGDIELF